MNETRNTWHITEENEDIQMIAASYGIKDWKLIYEHSQNKSLREIRTNPFILHEGDKVWIPSIESKQISLKDRKRNTLKIYPPKTVFQLVLRDDNGIPYKNVKYELWLNKNKFGNEEKRTREDGLIFENIPISREIELRVWFPVSKEKPDKDDENDDSKPVERDESYIEEEEIPIPEEELEENPDIYESFIFGIARLNPINTVEGLQDRLNNLGYYCGKEYGEIGEYTQESIREFQNDYELLETGEVDFENYEDDTTISKLKEVLKEK